MVNNMWERDKLFLLFEEDFRITPTDIEPPVSHKPAALIEVVGDNSTFLSSADAENQGGKQARHGIPGKGRWYEMPTKETDHDSFATPNLVLNDMVRYATLAHRAGCGDLTWMTWQPGNAGSNPKRKSSPASGSMFIMLSVPGAEVLTGAMDSGVLPMGHFDCKLLHWLRDLQLSSLRCSYLLPPMGNYGAHQSGCERVYAGEASVRPSCWQEKWCCPGTRILHAGRRSGAAQEHGSARMFKAERNGFVLSPAKEDRAGFPGCRTLMTCPAQGSNGLPFGMGKGSHDQWR